MKKIAMLATNGYEDSELLDPLSALRDAGHEVHVIAPGDGINDGSIEGKNGNTASVDAPLEQASADNYDALVLPGGLQNPDMLRMNDDAVEFAKHFVTSDKPIAAICHGPWTLINAEGVNGKTVTSWPSLQKDLENAGATWVDKEVVVDGKLVTSRNPNDIPAFNKAFMELLG
tara:strand:+ start:233 stop:751 length:519 start_codon:yes stop_codon:yes gene_type:complete